MIPESVRSHARSGYVQKTVPFPDPDRLRDSASPRGGSDAAGLSNVTGA